MHRQTQAAASTSRVCSVAVDQTGPQITSGQAWAPRGLNGCLAFMLGDHSTWKSSLMSSEALPNPPTSTVDEVKREGS